MSKRVCAEPGCPAIQDESRCPEHRRQRERKRGTRQQRGYDAAHVKLRAKWARKVATGRVDCARCHKRISPLDEWHLDHADDRAGYLGPSHALCNVAHLRISPRG